MKYWFPNISFPEIFNCKTKLHIREFVKGLPSICSDYPIINRNPDTFRVYVDDFILPINNTKIFLRGDNIQPINSLIKFEIDILLLKQSINYVSCTNERYINDLENLYAKHFNNLQELRDSIFNKFFK